MRDEPITWVRYFSWLVDELWHDPRLKTFSHRRRHEQILNAEWKRLLAEKAFRRNSYRRRLWVRLVKNKYRKINRIKRQLERGTLLSYNAKKGVLFKN